MALKSQPFWGLRGQKDDSGWKNQVDWLRIHPRNLKYQICATKNALVLPPIQPSRNFESPRKSVFESTFGGTYHFLHGEWSPEGRKFGRLGDSWTEEVALSQRQNWDSSGTKIASPSNKVSFESSEFRAFDRDLIEGATIFHLRMRVEILVGL